MAAGPFRAALAAATMSRCSPTPGQPDHVRVVVIDADDRVRESLCGLLCIGDRLEVVGSTGETGRAVDLVSATQPDVVLLDPRLPDVDEGVSFIERDPGRGARRPRPRPDRGRSRASQPAVAAAADGFVRKTFRPSDLVAAVLAASVRVAG